jgi:hypothetical protein
MMNSVLKTHYQAERVPFEPVLTGFFMLARRFNASLQAALQQIVRASKYQPILD